MVRAALLPLVAALTAAAASGSAPPPRSTQRFTIDLDREPEERFKEVAQHFKANILDFLKVIEGSAVKDIVEKIVKHRGPERSAELQAEIAGWAKYTGAPLVYAQVVHLLYELQTVMVPWENVTWPWGQTTRRTGLEPIFGCTGIIARSADSGTVTHARNMDFSFAKYFQNMSYLGTFVKNGKEVFTAQMIAPYSFPITAWRRGQNGYSVEINTRYPPKSTNVDSLIKMLFEEKREASGWVRRQVLQSVDSFEEAVEAFSTRPYATTEYDIIAGVQKGVILARDPDSVYHKLTLGPNRNDYIIVTNFDYWDHDLKEVLDPTSLHFGHARRVGAETLLNASKNINRAELYMVVNDENVMATDTIMQAFMNVEEDIFESFLPNCQDCGTCVAHGGCAAVDHAEGCCGVRSYWDFECGLSNTRRCGCLPDGACRAPDTNTSRGDEDCCSFQSYYSIADCPFGRVCGTAPTRRVEYV